MLSEKLYVTAIKKLLKDSKGPLKTTELIKGIIDFFYHELVKPNDQKLIDIAFSEKLTQADLNAFLQNWDIECAGSAKSLLLAYVMKTRPDLKFNQYTGPRLHGLQDFWRFKNLSLISHFTKIGKALNAKGIYPLILKGGAMKYLRPELSRAMGDIDILIDGRENYKKAIQIALDLGYDADDEGHSVDLHLKGRKEGICDIHNRLDFGSKYDPKLMHKFFERAKLKNIFGVKTYLPCFEDLVFIGLVNMIKNIREKTSIQGVLFTLFDIKYLTANRPDFNWDIITENIKQTNTCVQMYLAVKFANRVVSDLVFEKMIQDQTLQKKMVNYCNNDIMYCKYDYDLKYACKETKISSIFKGWKNLKYYCHIKIPHFFYKRIRKSQALTNLFLKLFYERGL